MKGRSLCKSSQAQGTIEYLVIIAIVVIIALVVVGLMTGFLSPSMAITEQAEQIGAATQSISLSEAIAGMDGNGVLRITNNTGEDITIDHIAINGDQKTINTSMPSGDTKSFTITDMEPCTGQQKSYDIAIHYTSAYGLEKTQSLGSTILQCEEHVEAAQPTQDEGTGGPGGAVCGNSTVEGTETCDSSTQACTAAGGYPGNQICLTNCTGYGACVSTLTCGDSIVNGSETCDSDTRACTIGGYNGTQLCRTDCTDYNACIATESCGDNNTNGAEVCDGTSLNGQTCNTQGYQAGTLACAPGCAAYNTSGCYNILTLTSTETGTYKDSETLAANIAGYSPTTKTYWYKWYKGNDLNATTLITNGLVAYWPLNSNANDFKGGHNFATAVGSPALGAGKVGKGYSFNGTSYIYGDADISDFEFGSGSFSVSIWIKSSSGAGQWSNPAIAYGTNLATSSNWKIYAGSTLFSYIWSGGSSYQAVSTHTTNDNEWHHILFMRDGTNLKLYVDGRLSATTAIGTVSMPNDPSARIMLGTDFIGGSKFTGLIDEPMVFNRALTATEVGQLYLGGAYDGNKMGSTRTAQGESWKVGVSDNNGAGWGPDYNSSVATITAFSCGDSINDDREFRSYRTVQIGSECWFKDNINVGTMIPTGGYQGSPPFIQKHCYSNNAANCDANGGLYNWHMAMQIPQTYMTTTYHCGDYAFEVQGICPTGWHIPSDNDWHALNTFFWDMNKKAGSTCVQSREDGCGTGAGYGCSNAQNYYQMPEWFDMKYGGICYGAGYLDMCVAMGEAEEWQSTYEYCGGLHDTFFFASAVGKSETRGVGRGSSCSAMKRYSFPARCVKN